jgi:hypothetical protein
VVTSSKLYEPTNRSFFRRHESLKEACVLLGPG